MNDLLDAAIAAHGGLDRWEQINTIAVDASITGAIWWVKGKGDALKDVRFEVDTRAERLAMDFVGQDKRSIFEPAPRGHASAPTAVAWTRATTRSPPLTATSAIPRGTTYTSRISAERHCGHT